MAANRIFVIGTILSMTLNSCDLPKDKKDQKVSNSKNHDAFYPIDYNSSRTLLVGNRKFYIPISWLLYGRMADHDTITHIVPRFNSQGSSEQVHHMNPSRAGVTLKIRYGSGNIKPVGVNERSRVTTIRLSGPIEFIEMGQLTKKYQIEDIQRIYNSPTNHGWVFFQNKYYDVTEKHYQYLMDAPSVWAYVTISPNTGYYKTEDGIRVEYEWSPLRDSIPNQMEKWREIRSSVKEVVKWLATTPDHRSPDPQFMVGGETYLDNP